MKVFGSPRRYVQGPDAIDRLGTELSRFAHDIVLVIDPVAESLYGARIDRTLHAAGLTATKLLFGGESSPAEVDRLVDRLEAVAGGRIPQLVAAAGGGKCIDAGKALAGRFKVPVATVPTIASTDAPTSHNYVLYDDQHRLLAVEKLIANPDLVLVDTAVIARAPRHLFLAGIGDAIVKPFEVERCMQAGGRNIFGAEPVHAALILAQGGYAILRRDAEAALAEVERQVPGPALERVIEATVLMSGLSFESGGLSIAHSMTRGLSAVPAYAAALHGFQVAYGLIVQLTLEGRPQEELADLATFYRRIGLPLSLRDLGAHAPSREDVGQIARLTLTAPHAKNFPRPLTEDDITQAIHRLEAGAAIDKPAHALYI